MPALTINMEPPSGFEPETSPFSYTPVFLREPIRGLDCIFAVAIKALGVLVSRSGVSLLSAIDATV